MFFIQRVVYQSRYQSNIEKRDLLSTFIEKKIKGNVLKYLHKNFVFWNAERTVIYIEYNFPSSLFSHSKRCTIRQQKKWTQKQIFIDFVSLGYERVTYVFELVILLSTIQHRRTIGLYVSDWIWILCSIFKFIWH